MKNKVTLISFFLLGFSIFCRSQSVPDSVYPSADLVISYHTEWTKTHYPVRIQEFKNNPLKQNDIVFLGNSLTELAGDWSLRFNAANVRNRGIAGDVTEGVLARLGEIYYFKPASVFIEIGINDLFASKTPEFIAGNICEMVRRIYHNTPETKVYVRTILPTSNQYLVADIKATNDILRDSASVSGYTLVELHDLFADASDLIKTEYTTDGVHLTAAGYEVWVNEEKKYIPSTPSSNLLKNAGLNFGTDFWDISGTAYMFNTIDWSPTASVLRSFGNNYWQWPDIAVNGSITQTVSGLQDGNYNFSCQFAGAQPGNKAYSALIAKDGNGVETTKEFTMPATWTKIEMPIAVTGGQCTVGFTIHDTTNSVFWFAASDFNLYAVIPTSTPDLNNTASIHLVNYPNPFNNETTLCFKLPYSEKNARLEIISLNGILLKSFFESTVAADRLYSYTFNANEYADQIFIVRLVTSDKVVTRKIVKKG